MTTNEQFRKKVWQYYHANRRSMPWRDDTSAYAVLVSEVMLQQTQVSRVMTKFPEFMTAFPNLASLADASLSDVLGRWQGLGYNRRAQYLHQSARKIVTDFAGQIPNNIVDLQSLPGIGKNTAAAICVYAFNQPHVFVETNIRTVFLHEFFPNRQDVSDSELLPLIEQALDTSNPREWYWALMDYGAHIKTSYGNASRRSRHHQTQTKFEGSRRQLRAVVLREILAQPISVSILKSKCSDKRVESVIEDLLHEGMITKDKQDRLVIL